MTGLAAYPALRAGRLAPLVYGLAAAALLTLLPPLLWRGHLIWLPLLLLAAEYITIESAGRLPADSIAVYAAGLISVCELLYWSAELPRSAQIDWAVAYRRLLSLLVIALAGALLALVALLGTSVQVSSALVAIVLGLLAAALLLAIPWLLLRERGEAG